MLDLTSYFDDISGIHVASAALCTFLVAYHLLAPFARRNSHPLPPGPRPMPLIGNLLDMPKGLEGPHWAKHKNLYGPISSVSAFGTTFIIINDMNIAVDLLDKRSAIHSSRPVLTFGGDLVGFNRWLTTFLPYNETFKLHRKLMHRYVGTRSAVAKFEEVETREAIKFVNGLINTPEKLMDHIRVLPGAVILKISHGYTVGSDASDPFIELADALGIIFSDACVPGRWLVDTIPSLKFLPAWFPGAGFQAKAQEMSKVIYDFCDKPFEFVKHQMANGRAADSLASDLLENDISSEVDEDTVKFVSSTLYAAGAETTVSAVETFLLAMTLYPSALIRARAELDHVVGTDRLPVFSDRPHLPYIDALMKETLRWQSVGPVGIPHCSLEEDSYMGYHIPKGSVILANIWQMSHDSEEYKDPFAFNPGRFLGENGQSVERDPYSMVFGFGRRICPGKEIADNSLFIAIAMVVAALDISKARDARGDEIEPLCDYAPGIVSHPRPFKCTILPRSEKATALVRSAFEENSIEEGDGEVLKSL